LDLACAFYGVQDREALVEALLTIKHHRRPDEGGAADEDETEDD
jgi:hypothetical protein